MNLPPKILLLSLCALMPASSIEIELRYDYDTSGFFNQPGAKEAMRACADFFENILTDSLTEINAATSGSSQNTWSARPEHPSTGEMLNLVDLVVPRDTMIIFLGARDFPNGTNAVATTGKSATGFAPFLNTVTQRGQSGAGTTPATDYGPWGGSISFDSRLDDGSPRQWNFSTSRSMSGRTNFVGVALHELCHLMGFGIAPSFKDLVPVGEVVFTGPTSKVANGGVEPLVRQDKGHWTSTSPGPYFLPTYGSFGTSHGRLQRALMDSRVEGTSTRLAVLTDLELAALIDVGWEVALPAGEIQTVEPVNGGLQISFPTTSNFVYRIQRGDLLTPFANLGDPIQGDGSVQTYLDENPPALKGFYRFTMSRAPSAGTRALRREPAADEKAGVRTVSDWWKSEGCCEHE